MSVLHLVPPAGPGDAESLTQVIRDLNLDQVFGKAIEGREEYDLRPHFEAPLREVAQVEYRQSACRDLEREGVRSAVDRFAQKMRQMRECQRLAQTLRHELQRARWFLDSAHCYCEAVVGLEAALKGAELTSPALSALSGYLSNHVSWPAFGGLSQEVEEVCRSLGEIRYALTLKGSRVSVARHQGEGDFSQEVIESFRRFQQGVSGDRLIRFPEPVEMNHIEAQILDLVARLFPDQFQRLRAFCLAHPSFADPALVRFDREVQFYLGYLDLIDPLRSAGHPFSYPVLSTHDRTTLARSTFDLALACRLVGEGSPVVTNDVHLEGSERFIVITGPNQGGKTTLARAFGQLHYLARLGLPVPGAETRLLLCDAVYTHFEREEQAEDLRGKLQDELVRMRDIVHSATARSVIVMNESFSSTTLDDARLIGREVVQRLVRLGALGVYVTFIDELSRLGAATVSMMSRVDSENAALRTFKVERRAADGLAYAAQLAQKHGLTYGAVRGRLDR